MAHVALRELTKRYRAHAAVRGLTLECSAGEFVTLLGPSGCGKTTTLRLLAGFLRPDAGEILVAGQVISSPRGVVPPERRGMGMVFQSYALWPHLNVLENVAFGLKLKRLPRTEVERRVRQALQRVGLEGFARRYPGQLSGGQQQRVALARSLVVEPSILLLDEPLSNLDAKLREMMRVELKNLQRETGITFVYVTHDQAEALAVSDRIAVLYEGQLLQYGTPREVYERPASRLVADLIGRVNLLPGHLVERHSARYGVVAINEGARLRAQVPDGAPTEVAVMVRPEDIQLQRAPTAGGNVLRGSVLNRLFLGNLIEYQVTTAGLNLRVQGPRDESFAPGEEVYVVLDEGRCLALA